MILSGVRTMEIAPSISDAWIDLSRRNRAVKDALIRFTEVSAAAVVIGMHVSMLAPFLASRGVIPEAMAGVSDETRMAAMAFQMAGSPNGTPPGGNN
jgi:hypothetical protein